jgi:NADPH:quinone reductase
VPDYVERLTRGAGFDVIFDSVGGATLDASFAAVGRFGHVVSALGWGIHALAPLSFRAATYSGIFTLLPLLTQVGRAHHGDILREASRLVDAGKVTPHLDARHFTLESVGDAYAAIAHRTARGRLVVDIT